MIERILFEYLLNSLWQLPLLLLATWLLVRAARPPLLVQHILWCAALLLAVALPLRGIDWPNAPAPQPVAPLESAWSESELLTLAAYPPPSAPVPQPLPLPHQVPSLFALRNHTLHLDPRTLNCLIALYALSVALSLARLVHGSLAARRLVASSIAHPLTALESALLNACAHRLGLPLSRLPELRFLPDPSASPMLIGTRRPVLLLPESLRHSCDPAFSDQALTAILAHELAHVRRRDFLANLLARVVSLPIAYHPATHALHRRIRQTREMLCDDHAAHSFDSATSYARSLLSLAERLIQPRHNIQPERHIGAVGLFDLAPHTATRSLEERIMKLTEARLPVSLAQRTARIAAGSVVLIAATCMAATLHLKPSAPAAFIVQAAAAPQQPVATPAALTPAQEPATTPVPAVEPAPAQAAIKVSPRHPRIIVNGEVRDLTPEERQKLDRDLSDATQKIHDATATFDNPEFQKQLTDSLKVLGSPEFKLQIEAAGKGFNTPEFRAQMARLKSDTARTALNTTVFRKQMEEFKNTLNSPEFRQQIANANRDGATIVLNDPKLKLEMENFKLQFNSPEFRKQVAEAKQLSASARSHSAARLSDARKQLDDATRALNEAAKQSHDAAVQKQLDDARRSIEQARRNF